MRTYFDFVLERLKSIDWGGPALFVVVILLVLLIKKKWSMLILIVFTILLSWGAQHLIVYNIETSKNIISVPLIIYCIGGGIVFILAAISIFKTSI